MCWQARTLRRPVRANTNLVQRVLGRLDDAGAPWAPRFLGVHGDHEVLTWLPGRPIEDWWQRPDLLDDLTRAVRQLHDVTASLAAGHECLVHDDLQPRNVVVDGRRVGIIDWEQVRPGRRVEDVSQICWSFARGSTESGVQAVGERWRRVVDAYGLVNRTEVVAAALAKIDRCVDDVVRRSAAGSVRHRALHDRGDHEDLAALRRWIATNRSELSVLVE